MTVASKTDTGLSLRALLALGGLGFVFFLVLLAPAQLILSYFALPAGVGYGAASGTIWQAKIHDLAIDGRAFGDGRVRLAPLPLLTGDLVLDIGFDGPAGRGTFRWRHGKAPAITDLSLVTDLRARLGGQVFAGALAVTDGHIALDEAGRCRVADGQVRSNILVDLGGFEGLLLMGTLACRDARPAVSFAGENGLFRLEGHGLIGGFQAVPVDLWLMPKADAHVPQALILALEFAGLRRVNEGWRGQLILDIS